MEMLQSLAEAVLIAFLLGAVFGAIVAVHIQSRRPVQKKTREQAPLHIEGQPVRVKAQRRDW